MWVLYVLTLCGQWVGLNLHECWMPIDQFDTKAACVEARDNSHDMGKFECGRYGVPVDG